MHIRKIIFSPEKNAHLEVDHVHDYSVLPAGPQLEGMVGSEQREHRERDSYDDVTALPAFTKNSLSTAFSICRTLQESLM